MFDPRMTQLAEVLINYSTAMKTGEKILVDDLAGLNPSGLM